MTTSEVESRNIAISMRKSVENLVISSQDAIGQSISQAITFSGVITQSNQLLQETKNLSRSPSPSLRHTDSTLDIIDDKRSEKSDSSLHVPSLGNEIPIGIDVANLVRDKTVTARIDGAGTVRAKKKSWYNSLYPTYKSKCEDFKRLFKDLPDEERLIVDYSCALQRDILAHGRLYASQSYLCFYASIFGWETCLTLRWKDVTAITKEKTALVIPNAILVCTETDKNFFTSFSGRDKCYLMLFRIWQNALMDQPMSSQEIWQWVHSCYGEELGFDSDEESGAPDATDVPDASEEAVDSFSMDAVGGGGAGGGDARSVSRSNSTPPLYHLAMAFRVSKVCDRRECLSMRMQDGFVVVSREAGELLSAEVADGTVEVAEEVTNGDSEFRGREEEVGDTLPTDMSDTSDSEPEKPPNNGEEDKCTSPHEGKVFLQQEFPINIDQLFTMMFTNSKFNLELLAARGTTDYVQAPWQPQNGLKCRQVSYTLSLTSGPVGPKEVHVTETQVMNKCSRPGALYSIECTSENAGIPYADYFSVQAHYCLRRAAPDATALTLTGHVRYKKTMWPLVKAFLEKNTMGGMEEYARLLEARLSSAARPARAGGGAPAPARRAPRRRGQPPAARAPPPAPPAPAPRARAAWPALALLLLLALNALLYWRLYLADTRARDLDQLTARSGTVSAAQAQAWARALERHARRQRGELLAWRAALDRAVALLAQTEKALAKLLETIKPALENTDDNGHEEL